MPLVTRADGVQFAVYTYRELLTAKSSSLLKREVALMSKEHGEFARFFLQPDSDIEAVFSREPGYLLGETIFAHFNEPTDLLYCEQLDKDNALLVIIRGGTVFLDAALPIANLMDEFIALLSGSNRYEIYVYGNLPLAEQASEDKFAFEPALVKSFTQLKKPVFPSLVANEDFKLLPVKAAINELPSTDFTLIKLLFVLVFLGAIGFGIWKTLEPKPTAAPIGSLPPPIVSTPQDPYLGYQTALNTPAPSDILIRITQQIKTLITIPGWDVIQADFKDNEAEYTLSNIGGDTEILLAWIKAHNADLDISSGAAKVRFTLEIANRAKPTTIYNLRDMDAAIYDRLKRIDPDMNISLATKETGANYKLAEFTVSFSNGTLAELSLLARLLQGMPVVLISSSLAISSGIITGNLVFDVLGA